MNNEIGRELKVSELKWRTVVVLAKANVPMLSTMWVAEVTKAYVLFTSGVLRMDFMAQRTGPDLEQITDNTGEPMKIYEYLGEV
ncbi:MAG TPA: hypothetical protein VNW90_19315 [Acetobacteraceae bacterium]|jgi:hypothetical protein|nr:hypothetical protein [Acetobacteraceae bacterium]